MKTLTPNGFIEYCADFDRTLFVKLEDGNLVFLNYCQGSYYDWDFYKDNPKLRELVSMYLSALNVLKWEDTEPCRFVGLVNLAIDEIQAREIETTTKDEYKSKVKWARNLSKKNLL